MNFLSFRLRQAPGLRPHPEAPLGVLEDGEDDAVGESVVLALEGLEAPAAMRASPVGRADPEVAAAPSAQRRDAVVRQTVNGRVGR